MTIYALCSNCGNTLIDTGETRFIVCEKCGRRIPSRVYGKLPLSPGERSEELIIGGEEGSYYSMATRRQDNFWGARATREPPSILSSLRAVGGFLCSVAIICFIVVLTINLIAFFPAAVITASGLVDEHEITIETRIPLIIDNTPPEFLKIDDYPIVSTPGQPVCLTVNISDEHLKESYIELPIKDYDSSFNAVNTTIIEKIPLHYDREIKKYAASFQSPPVIGLYHPRLIAIDFAGNFAEQELSLDVRSTNKPIMFLTEPKHFTNINSSTRLDFKPATNDVQDISYNLDTHEDNVSTVTLEAPYSIATTEWLEGEHQLNITVHSDSGLENYLNFSIYLDDTPPTLTSLSITPLTIDRNETFKTNLGENTFYRGEFVRLRISIRETHLRNAVLLLENTSYDLVPVQSDTEFQDTKVTDYETIFSMPKNPDKYKLTVAATDFAGNIKTSLYNFHIARINFDEIPVPILYLDIPDSTINLPIINSSAYLELPIKFGKIIEINFTDTQTGTTVKSLQMINSQDSYNLTGIPEVEGFVGIKAQGSYHYRDHLFISFPYPPYLFILPIVLSGGYLLGFFILIALAIILSNLYLFTSSTSEAFKEIKGARGSLRAPMMESNNTIIMLAQLFLAVISFNIIYNQILAWGQVPVHIPDFSALSNWALIYNFTSAAVYEEIISRILLIGIPLYIVHAIFRKLQKPKRNYIFGGGFEINKLTILLILFSSITFGLAHAPGWDHWKVIPTSVSGFALGYLFLRKGIFAAILLHFTVNFLTIPLQMLNYPLGPSLLFSFMFLFWIAIGIIYMGYYLTRITGSLSKTKTIHNQDKID